MAPPGEWIPLAGPRRTRTPGRRTSHADRATESARPSCQRLHRGLWPIPSPRLATYRRECRAIELIQGGVLRRASPAPSRVQRSSTKTPLNLSRITRMTPSGWLSSETCPRTGCCNQDPVSKGLRKGLMVCSKSQPESVLKSISKAIKHDVYQRGARCFTR